MPGPSRRKAEAALLMALACGGTVERAAQQVGLSERTVYRHFRSTVRCRQSEHFIAVESAKHTNRIPRLLVFVVALERS